MNKLLLHLKYWQWAAMHSPLFQAFEIKFYSFPIQIKRSFLYSCAIQWSIQITLFKPIFWFAINTPAAEDKRFAKEMNIHPGELYTFYYLPF